MSATWKSSAIQVLKQSGKPFHVRVLCDKILNLGLIPTPRTSKPWASLNSTLSDNSKIFYRLAKGHPVFGLIEFAQQYENQARDHGTILDYVLFLSSGDKKSNTIESTNSFTAGTIDANNYYNRKISRFDDFSVLTSPLEKQIDKFLQATTTPSHIGDISFNIFNTDDPSNILKIEQILKSGNQYYQPSMKFPQYWAHIANKTSFHIATTSFNGMDNWLSSIESNLKFKNILKSKPPDHTNDVPSNVEKEKQELPLPLLPSSNPGNEIKNSPPSLFGSVEPLPSIYTTLAPFESTPMNFDEDELNSDPPISEDSSSNVAINNSFEAIPHNLQTPVDNFQKDFFHTIETNSSSINVSSEGKRMTAVIQNDLNYWKTQIIPFFYLTNQPIHYSTITNSLKNRGFNLSNGSSKYSSHSSSSEDDFVLSFLKTHKDCVSFQHGYFGLESLLPKYKNQALEFYINSLHTVNSIRTSALYESINPNLPKNLFPSFVSEDSYSSSMLSQQSNNYFHSSDYFQELAMTQPLSTNPVLRDKRVKSKTLSPPDVSRSSVSSKSSRFQQKAMNEENSKNDDTDDENDSDISDNDINEEDSNEEDEEEDENDDEDEEEEDHDEEDSNEDPSGNESENEDSSLSTRPRLSNSKEIISNTNSNTSDSNSEGVLDISDSSSYQAHLSLENLNSKHKLNFNSSNSFKKNVHQNLKSNPSKTKSLQKSKKRLSKHKNGSLNDIFYTDDSLKTSKNQNNSKPDSSSLKKPRVSDVDEEIFNSGSLKDDLRDMHMIIDDSESPEATPEPITRDIVEEFFLEGEFKKTLKHLDSDLNPILIKEPTNSKSINGSSKVVKDKVKQIQYILDAHSLESKFYSQTHFFPTEKQSSSFPVKKKKVLHTNKAIQRKPQNTADESGEISSTSVISSSRCKRPHPDSTTNLQGSHISSIAKILNRKSKTHPLVEILARWSTPESIGYKKGKILTWKAAALTLLKLIRIPLHFRDITVILVGLQCVESRSNYPWNSLNSAIHKSPSLFIKISPNKPVYGIPSLLQEYQRQVKLFGSIRRYVDWLTKYSPFFIDLINQKEIHFPYSEASSYSTYKNAKSKVTIDNKTLYQLLSQGSENYSNSFNKSKPNSQRKHNSKDNISNFISKNEIKDLSSSNQIPKTFHVVLSSQETTEASHNNQNHQEFILTPSSVTAPPSQNLSPHSSESSPSLDHKDPNFQKNNNSISIVSSFEKSIELDGIFDTILNQKSNQSVNHKLQEEQIPVKSQTCFNKVNTNSKQSENLSNSPNISQRKLSLSSQYSHNLPGENVSIANFQSSLSRNIKKSDVLVDSYCSNVQVPQVDDFQSSVPDSQTVNDFTDLSSSQAMPQDSEVLSRDVLPSDSDLAKSCHCSFPRSSKNSKNNNKSSQKLVKSHQIDSKTQKLKKQSSKAEPHSSNFRSESPPMAFSSSKIEVSHANTSNKMLNGLSKPNHQFSSSPASFNTFSDIDLIEPSSASVDSMKIFSNPWKQSIGEQKNSLLEDVPKIFSNFVLQNPSTTEKV